MQGELRTGRAVLPDGVDLADTLVAVENLGGSTLSDFLLGDERANTFYAVNISPSPSSEDILPGGAGTMCCGGSVAISWRAGAVSIRCPISRTCLFELI